MLMPDISRLAKSWIFAQKLEMDSPGYEKHSWAVDEIINLSIDKPEVCWQIIELIRQLDSSKRRLG